MSEPGNIQSQNVINHCHRRRRKLYFPVLNYDWKIYAVCLSLWTMRSYFGIIHFGLSCSHCFHGGGQSISAAFSSICWPRVWGLYLQSMGLLRVRHDWAMSLSLFTFMHWRRKGQPTPVFLPGESQGQGSLAGCRLWGRTESDTTEAT